MIDCDTFVKSLLAGMWLLNDLPRSMRKDLDSQLGVIWLLISDKKCFPTLQFTPEQQQAICQALRNCSDNGEDFKFTYEAMLNNEDLKVKEVAGNETQDGASPTSPISFEDPQPPATSPSTSSQDND